MENKYEVYRKIRYQRTYRTLGKMSLWRVVLGLLLLLSTLFISGLVSQRIAARGNFQLAEKLMVAPGWMEKYKPETKDFIEAGVLYQNGEYEASAEAFAVIEEVDAVPAMISRCNLKIASENLAGKDFDAAYASFILVDYSHLDEDAEEYASVCNALYEHYKNADTQKAEKLEAMLNIES